MSYNYSINDLLEEFGSEDTIVESLQAAVESGDIVFPFYNTFVDITSQEMLENIKRMDLAVINPDRDYQMRSYFPKYKSYLPPRFRGRPTQIVKSNFGDTKYQADIISDLYVEDIRLSARRKEDTSVAEDWMRPEFRDKVFRTMLASGEMSPFQLREAIYTRSSEASLFNPLWAKAILKVAVGDNLKGKYWLDMSSGWGDRLITSIALKMNYLGCDPNTDLQPRYEQMMDDLGQCVPQANVGKQDNVSYICVDGMERQVIPEPFETCKKVNEYAKKIGGFDVAFTSPPFFDREIYNDQSTQSAVRYGNSVEDWMRGFMFPSLRRAWDCLKDQGYLILHIGDSSQAGVNICEPIMWWIEDNLENSSWEGLIGLVGGMNFPRPVFCWKKSSEKKRWKKDRMSMERGYPELVDSSKPQSSVMSRGTSNRSQSSSISNRSQSIVSNVTQDIPKISQSPIISRETSVTSIQSEITQETIQDVSSNLYGSDVLSSAMSSPGLKLSSLLGRTTSLQPKKTLKLDEKYNTELDLEKMSNGGKKLYNRIMSLNTGKVLDVSNLYIAGTGSTIVDEKKKMKYRSRALPIVSNNLEAYMRALYLLTGDYEGGIYRDDAEIVKRQ